MAWQDREGTLGGAKRANSRVVDTTIRERETKKAITPSKQAPMRREVETGVRPKEHVAFIVAACQDFNLGQPRKATWSARQTWQLA